MDKSDERSRWYVGPVLAIACFLGGPLAAKLGLLPPLYGFFLFAASAVFGVAGFIWGVWLLVSGQRQRGLYSIFLSGLPLLVIGLALLRTSDKPLINDVTTDISNPPAFQSEEVFGENLGHDLHYPPEFAEIQTKDYPEIQPLRLPLPAGQVYELVVAEVKQHGWQIFRADPIRHSVEGAATSGIFSFVDDFVIRIQSESEGSVVDMRSRSRKGRGDFGANAQRIQTFLDELKNKASAIPGH